MLAVWYLACLCFVTDFGWSESTTTRRRLVQNGVGAIVTPLCPLTETDDPAVVSGYLDIVGAAGVVGKNQAEASGGGDLTAAVEAATSGVTCLGLLLRRSPQARELFAKVGGLDKLYGILAHTLSGRSANWFRAHNEAYDGTVLHFCPALAQPLVIEVLATLGDLVSIRPNNETADFGGEPNSSWNLQMQQLQGQANQWLDLTSYAVRCASAQQQNLAYFHKEQGNDIRDDPRYGVMDTTALHRLVRVVEQLQVFWSQPAMARDTATVGVEISLAGAAISLNEALSGFRNKETSIGASRAVDVDMLAPKRIDALLFLRELIRAITKLSNDMADSEKKAWEAFRERRK